MSVELHVFLTNESIMVKGGDDYMVMMRSWKLVASRIKK